MDTILRVIFHQSEASTQTLASVSLIGAVCFNWRHPVGDLPAREVRVPFNS